MPSKGCAKCGAEEDNHDYEICDGPVKCSNCKGAHAAFSRECPLWKEEKEILNLKYTKNLSFSKAQQLIKQRKAEQAPLSFPVRYADVTAPKKEDCHTCKILTAFILKKVSRDGKCIERDTTKRNIGFTLF